MFGLAIDGAPLPGFIGHYGSFTDTLRARSRRGRSYGLIVTDTAFV